MNCVYKSRCFVVDVVVVVLVMTVTVFCVFAVTGAAVVLRRY